MEICFPDSLIDLWHATHEPNHNLSSSIGDLYIEITKKISQSLRDSMKISSSVADDIAHDYLYKLISGPFGNVQAKTQFSFLTKDAKKMATQKLNPAGYELDDIINKALLALERRDEIIRDDASKKRYICNLTMFKLTTAPDRDGEEADYEQNAGKIRSVTIQSEKHERLMTPKMAEQLVADILTAFNGWIGKGTIREAVIKNIPDCTIPSITSLECYEKDGMSQEEAIDSVGYQSSREDSRKDFNDKQCMVEFYGDQASELSANTAETVWSQLCKKQYEKVFCLYHLPKNYGQENDPKPTLDSFGYRASTADYQDKIVGNILRQETCLFLGLNPNLRIDSLQRKAVKLIMSEILMKLYHRCLEKDLNPHLSSYEDERA